jgi:hypothetical protein
MKKILEANAVVSGIFAMCSVVVYIATQSVITALITISVAMLVAAFITRPNTSAIVNQTLELFGKSGLAVAFFLFSLSSDELNGVGTIAGIVIAIMFMIHSIMSCHEIAVNAKRNGALEHRHQLFLISIPVVGLIVGEAVLTLRFCQWAWRRLYRSTR